MHKVFSKFVAVYIVLFGNCELLFGVLVLMAFDVPVLKFGGGAFVSNIMNGSIDISVIGSSLIQSWSRVVWGGGQSGNHPQVVAEAIDGTSVWEWAVACQVVL